MNSLAVDLPLAGSPKTTTKQGSSDCIFQSIYKRMHLQMNTQLTEEQLEEVYNWVDEVTLSRPKRNMSRDFSDGVLFAEIVEHYNPKLVEMHNYVATGAVNQKINNWKTLNRKILSKMKLSLGNENIEALANATPGEIEKLIFQLKKVIAKGEMASPSTISKGNTNYSFGVEDTKPKPYHKMGYNEIKKKKQVQELVGGKESEITLLKESLSLLVLKSAKLQEMLRSKDREIEELVSLIKNKK